MITGSAKNKLTQIIEEIKLDLENILFLLRLFRLCVVLLNVSYLALACCRLEQETVHTNVAVIEPGHNSNMAAARVPLEFGRVVIPGLSRGIATVIAEMRLGLSVLLFVLVAILIPLKIGNGEVFGDGGYPMKQAFRVPPLGGLCLGRRPAYWDDLERLELSTDSDEYISINRLTAVT